VRHGRELVCGAGRMCARRAQEQNVADGAGSAGGAQARVWSACGSRRCRWSREAAAVRAGERRHHGGRLRLMSEDALAACSAERRGGAAALGQCRRAIVARSERAQRGNRRVRARASSEHESGSDLV
jgi:hypothetical protein